MTLMPRLMLLLLALSPLSTLAAPPAPLVEGKDYDRIADAGPFAPLAGKIDRRPERREQVLMPISVRMGCRRRPMPADMSNGQHYFWSRRGLATAQHQLL